MNTSLKPSGGCLSSCRNSKHNSFRAEIFLVWFFLVIYLHHLFWFHFLWCMLLPTLTHCMMIVLFSTTIHSIVFALLLSMLSHNLENDAHMEGCMCALRFNKRGFPIQFNLIMTRMTEFSVVKAEHYTLIASLPTFEVICHWNVD